jgi:hypothetical protein
MRTLLFRLGFTSEARWAFGLSADWLPWTVGIEISPGSTLGLMRAFAGAKYGPKVPPAAYTNCSTFVKGSAAAALAFGPRQSPHAGLQLGAHLERLSWWSSQREAVKDVGNAEALAYRFSWFPGAGFLHVGSAELGLVSADRDGYCGSD